MGQFNPYDASSSSDSADWTESTSDSFTSDDSFTTDDSATSDDWDDGDWFDDEYEDDWMTGGSGDDVFVWDSPHDQVFEAAGFGHDLIRVLLNFLRLPDYVEDLVFGGRGAFRGFGNDMGNWLAGGAGNDTLWGGGGNDSLDGTGGADTLDGGTGADTLNGGTGNDVYSVDSRRDVIVESLRSGVADLVEASISFTLARYLEDLVLTGRGNLDGTGNSSDNDLDGNAGNNDLVGAGGDDALDGGAGNDDLDGGDGADELTGGSGTDTLDGGIGNDTLTGGKGGDAFSFNRAGSGVDRIRDFNSREGDSVHFLRSAFGALSSGRLSSRLFTANGSGKATSSAQRFVYNTTTDTLYYDRDGSGRAAAVKVATFDRNVTLRASDIVIDRS